MGKLDASDIATLLREMGQRMALQGGNPYRSRAYRRAAESLAAQAEPLERIIAEGRLREIPGIGEAIADTILEFHKTGSHRKLEALRREVPESVRELLAVQGLRPEKVLQLYNDFGIASLADLETAAKEDRLSGMKGMGAALQRKVLESIEAMRQGGGQIHIHRAGELLDAATASLTRAYPNATRIEPAGDFRRGCELVSELRLVAELPGTAMPESLRSGSVEVHLTDKRRYGITLLMATGSADHLQQLKAFAEARGLALDEQGLRRGRRTIASKTEEDVYGALGLPYIAPELREGGPEIELASMGRLPNLVSERDIRGILHAHTEASDGLNTLEEMAEATRRQGYTYFGVSDHSQSAHYAGGLSPIAIEAQHAAVDRLNAGYSGAFRIFKGIESDILSDGSLDYPDDILDRFDFVVASVHSRFRLDRDTQTRRIIRAVENPYTTILGHMTGRQLLRRPGYDVDIEAVLRACALTGVAVEINANPWRLDLDWRWHSLALELGCLMSINPDAHSVAELDLTRWGVTMARKGSVPKERVLNCLDLKSISKLFSSQRQACSGR